jgi:outer membrane murein-binding lipoprotein Lpp
MQHDTSHENTAKRVGAGGALTAARTLAVLASVLLTAACASQASLDREATETNSALATANQAKAEADQALVAAQQAQASAQSANERADKMFQRNLHK